VFLDYALEIIEGPRGCWSLSSQICRVPKSGNDADALVEVLILGVRCAAGGFSWWCEIHLNAAGPWYPDCCTDRGVDHR
jgi:hypothetical protein